LHWHAQRPSSIKEALKTRQRLREERAIKEISVIPNKLQKHMFEIERKTV